MRLRPKFSLRTLLIAVLLAGVGCWYFVNGELFNTRNLITFEKVVRGNEYWGYAFVTTHSVLPRIRFNAAIFMDPGGARRYSWKDSMDPSKEEPLRYFNNDSINWQVKNGLIDASSKDGPRKLEFEMTHVGLVYENNTTGPSWRIGPNHHRFSPILQTTTRLTWNEFLAYCNDSSVSEWSVASLEKWLLHYRK